jgi:putative spermidine/putrescine transport system permease protein
MSQLRGEKTTDLWRRKKRRPVGSLALDVVAYATLAFLLTPIVVVVSSSFTSGDYVGFPPVFPLSLRWYSAFLESPIYLPALKNSMIIGILVVLVSFPIGVAAAIGWTRRDFRGKQLVYFLLFLPFLVPALVIGIGMLMSLHPLSLDALAGTRLVVVIGHSILATPLVFLVMVGVLHSVEPNLVSAARDLGASAGRAFYEVTLPLVRAGALAAIVLAFITSFHEFIVSLFLTAGSRNRTLPVEVWTALRFELSPIIAAIDTLMVASVIVALIVVSRLVGLDKIRLG